MSAPTFTAALVCPASDYSLLRRRAVEMQQAATALIDQIDLMGNAPAASGFPEATIETVARDVARIFGLPFGEITGRAKFRRCIEARWTAYFFCLFLTKRSGVEISRVLKRDGHAAIYYGIRSLIDLYKIDPEFASRHRAIEKELCSVFGFVPGSEAIDSGPISNFRRTP